MRLLESYVRRAKIEDSESLANIIVESWRSAYSDLIPIRMEMVKWKLKIRIYMNFMRI